MTLFLPCNRTQDEYQYYKPGSTRTVSLLLANNNPLSIVGQAAPVLKPVHEVEGLPDVAST